jgi:thioredoxin reductase
MVTVAIIGGGPAGLSAALFTAKNDLETVVFDTDETAMHAAYLWNYLGIEAIDGDEFMEIARSQVREHGAALHQGEEVTTVEKGADGFEVTTTDETYQSSYVVFASGRARELASELGCATRDDGTIQVDLNTETSVKNAYATGWTVRKDKIQAIISAGDGAAAAVDILSRETGESFHDFDTPPAE